MEDKLIEKIETIIYKIIFDENTSLVEKVAELSQFFDKYNNYSYSCVLPPFKKPSPEIIKILIIDTYRVEEGLLIITFRHITEKIAKIILDKHLNDLINK